MAIYDLRLTPKQFYRLTPRQFHLLVRRHNYATEHRELLHGMISSAVINFSMSAPKQPTKPQDFMPSMWQNTKTRKPRTNNKHIANECRTLFKGLTLASQPKEANDGTTDNGTDG